MPIELTTMEASTRSVRPRIDADKISADVIQAVEEGLEWCKTNDGRLAAKFAGQELANDFLHEARSYAYHHVPRLIVIGNTTKGGQARFRVELFEVTDQVAAETAETAETA